MNRRDFLASAALLVAVRQDRSITVQDILDRIRAGIGVPWQDKTVDGLKAGDPALAVRGIAVTVMATLDVLRQAAASGHNLIVTHEPVFYSANDEPGARAADPVYLAKKALIEQKGLGVYRFSDHWRARPDPAHSMARALATDLVWPAPDAEGFCAIPPTTLGALAAHVGNRLRAGGLRTVGRSDLRITRVVLSPGTTDLAGTLAKLPRADAMIAGEPREWEAVPYALDTWTSGQNKGLISLGRVASEGPGMRACADWIRTIVREVPVRAIDVADPYWRPTA